jgi:hypothetical protein
MGSDTNKVRPGHPDVKGRAAVNGTAVNGRRLRTQRLRPQSGRQQLVLGLLVKTRGFPDGKPETPAYGDHCLPQTPHFPARRPKCGDWATRFSQEVRAILSLSGSEAIEAVRPLKGEP